MKSLIFRWLFTDKEHTVMINALYQLNDSLKGTILEDTNKPLIDKLWEL
jgi:hypothetical protein